MILQGYSGCIVDYNDGLVRKSSKDEAYNQRLILQCFKQKYFKSVFFNSPSVLKTGFLSNIFYFEYSYIPGNPLSEINNLSIHLEFLKKYISAITQEYTPDYSAKKIIENKCDALKAIKYSTHTVDIIKIINKLEKLPWSFMPASTCHGDLTFENILYSEETRSYYLIDFLDSFYNSWLLDVAKLQQDTLVKWCFRNKAIKTNHKSLDNFNEYIQRTLETINPNLSILITGVIILNLLRILPYSKSEFDSDFLLTKIKNLCTLL